MTILDFSPAMIERAEQRLANEAKAVRRRVTLIEGRGEEVSVRCGERAFDGVLCHGVVM
ncbi:MAG: class I SAM-dependent methyltransferase [Actinomycetota bacterium]|nr:class I SAM-dependent methyltransferase [Actinomycetota bacterium]